MVVHYHSLFRPIDHCSLNDCFSFYKIRQTKYCSECQLQKNNPKILGNFEFATSSGKLLIQQEKLWCSGRIQNNLSTLNLSGTKRSIQNHVKHLRQNILQTEPTSTANCLQNAPSQILGRVPNLPLKPIL